MPYEATHVNPGLCYRPTSCPLCANHHRQAHYGYVTLATGGMPFEVEWMARFHDPKGSPRCERYRGACSMIESVRTLRGVLLNPCRFLADSNEAEPTDLVTRTRYQWPAAKAIAVHRYHAASHT